MTLLAGAGLALLPSGSTSAISVFESCGSSGVSDSAVCKASQEDTSAAASGNVTKIINAMLYVLGIIAVVMVVVAGIRYATSAGNATKVKGAKDTLMYAIVGLIVAMLAWSIVNFVVGQF